MRLTNLEVLTVEMMWGETATTQAESNHAT